jgi:hypothetical protein
MQLSIYGMDDPRTHELRYVGQTIKPLEQRKMEHLYEARYGKRARRFIWMRSLLAADIEPEIFLLEEVSEVEADEAEQFWIAYFKSLGANLVNGTEGGGGARGYKHDPASVERRSAKQRGWKFTEEHRQRMSEARKAYFANGGVSPTKGKKMSPETRRKISESRSGVVPDIAPERWAEIQAKRWATRRANGTDKHSKETKQRLSELHRGKPTAMKGKKHSVEARAKMSAAKRGKSWTQAQRAAREH